MNKKLFTGLIILMGISIFGIITIQLVWMNNALKVKNELFIRGVNDALVNTASRLQKIQDLTLINEMVFADSIHMMQHEMTFDIDYENEEDEIIEFADEDEFTSKNGSNVYSIKKKIIPRKTKPIHIVKEIRPKNGNTQISLQFESDSNNSGIFKYYVKHIQDSANHTVYINGPACNDILLVGGDSITTKLDSLINKNYFHLDSLLTKMDTSIIGIPEVTKKAKQRVWKFKESLNQFVSEINTFDIKKLDNELIEKVLKEELLNKNIPIDFEYGIFVDTILTSKSDEIDAARLYKSELFTKLYPNDIIEKNIKLALFFPGRDSFIYNSVGWLLIASLIFSMIVLLTFALSIYYILNQKKVSEMKSDFINNMTHEFKTPIATISVAADSIANDKVIKDPERIRYFTGMIKKENIRMNRQVEDILTIARLDKKDFEFKWEAINAHELINDAIQGIILQVGKRGGKIETDLNAANPVITTDKMHCTNIIYNLIDNANKYSLNTPEIKVSTKNNTKGMLITVTDAGIGISKTVQSRIFERFYRQASGNIHNVKGFGLGLSYVKAVVEANKGSITVQSEPEKGSIFSVFLPFMRE